MLVVFRRSAKHLMLLCIMALVLSQSASGVVFTEVRVNSDSTPVTELPNMDFNCTCGRMVAVWDEYATPYSVWFQILDQDLNKIGENSLASDDLYDAVISDVAVAGTGDFSITYRGRSAVGDSTQVYVRFFHADGTPKGSSMKVADDGVVIPQWEPAIASDSIGNVAVTWEDKRIPGREDVWVQLFANTGNKIGTNIRVSDDLDSCCLGYQKISMNSSGRFIVTWHAYTRTDDPYLFGGKDIRFQLFEADGSKIGDIGTANSSTSDVRRKEPAVSIDRSGAFVVAWVTTIENALYVQFYDSYGNPIGTNLKVQRSEEPDETAISLNDNGMAVMAWEEDRPGSGMGVFYQLFQSTALSGNPEIIMDSIRYSPSVNTSPDDAYFLYEAPDMRVMAAKLREIVTDFKDVDAPQLPGSFALSQNYPNPFNPITKISFSLPRVSNVAVYIYDIMGRKVRTLVNEMISAGEKAVEWDGKNDDGMIVSSGIYFCRIVTGDFSESKKMILLK